VFGPVAAPLKIVEAQPYYKPHILRTRKYDKKNPAAGSKLLAVVNILSRLCCIRTLNVIVVNQQ
jgi:hypothetical protein